MSEREFLGFLKKKKTKTSTLSMKKTTIENNNQHKNKFTKRGVGADRPSLFKFKFI